MSQNEREDVWVKEVLNSGRKTTAIFLYMKKNGMK